ncbi:uncharacterized protein L969DRAFT_55757 [Mixia osmundae IAM 14324]|uniref:uncharacterized protein n=1 Tax=Mixia osmundae (strain CBS 9802 / IAM 14324 / JCM 22182 / KY 12970) TaxID=764103 RepID=UPI0004A5579A|nr:uncharacterized protein L969DRAFT_55757 [Mixia osmundae IAM 14324]KEI36092.1 hypothetical protein L969DRAFT_55757 [Mixia osmundae IAM 14324]
MRNFFSLTTLNSPLEQFEVVPFMGLNVPLLGVFNFTLTNLAFYSLLVLVILTALHLLALNNLKVVPSK